MAGKAEKWADANFAERCGGQPPQIGSCPSVTSKTSGSEAGRGELAASPLDVSDYVTGSSAGARQRAASRRTRGQRW
jgi:hypothetical protein